jgi:hypothetical protein
VLLYGGADTGLTALQLLGPFVSVAAASGRCCCCCSSAGCSPEQQNRSSGV